MWVWSTLRKPTRIHFQAVVLTGAVLFISACVCVQADDVRASYSNRLSVSQQLWAALVNNNGYKFFFFVCVCKVCWLNSSRHSALKFCMKPASSRETWNWVRYTGPPPGGGRPSFTVNVLQIC